MYILGDIGNTEIKICIYSNKLKLLKKKIIQTRFLDQKKNDKEFNFLLKSKKKITKILFCSVVPKSYSKLKNFFIKKLNIRPIEVKEINLNDLINIKINKKQVGSDRIVNAIGINDKKQNYIVLDFGTATTFDVIKKPGIYDGGVIAPGVKSSINKLNELTALLPLIDLKSTTRTYGKNTNDALNSGFLWGYQGLINNIIKKIISSGKIKYKVILTGGYANLFKHLIINKPLIDQNITIKGVIKVYKDLIL